MSAIEYETIHKDKTNLLNFRVNKLNIQSLGSLCKGSKAHIALKWHIYNEKIIHRRSLDNVKNFGVIKIINLNKIA